MALAYFAIVLNQRFVRGRFGDKEGGGMGALNLTISQPPAISNPGFFPESLTATVLDHGVVQTPGELLGKDAVKETATR